MTEQTISLSERIRIVEEKLLSDNWAILKKTTLDFQRSNGEWQTLIRETYDRGNGVTILLYNREKRTVILTRQFRYPVYVNGWSGLLIETCAGLLDQREPGEAIRRETEEETGYRVDAPQKVMEIYMSPGSVTEKLYFFTAEYHDDHRIGAGGGLIEDGEDIGVLELPADEAMEMIERGEIVDGKTIILLQYARLHQLI